MWVSFKLFSNEPYSRRNLEMTENPLIQEHHFGFLPVRFLYLLGWWHPSTICRSLYNNAVCTVQIKVGMAWRIHYKLFTSNHMNHLNHTGLLGTKWNHCSEFTITWSIFELSSNKCTLVLKVNIPISYIHSSFVSPTSVNWLIRNVCMSIRLLCSWNG